MSSALPRELGRAFADEDVARNYRVRPSYPAEIFDVLERLMVAPRTALDAGCGSGALTHGLARLAERVDAVDPSEAMIREARRLFSTDHARIRWIVGRAEDAPLDPPYGLIVAGASIHWMDPTVVMSRFRDALAPGARLAIADAEWVYPDEPWQREILALIRRYSPVRHHQDFAGVVESLVRSKRFVREGEHRTPAAPVERSVAEYLAMLRSTSSLSRATLGDRAGAFEAQARTILAGLGVGRIRFDVVGALAWGQPVAR